jgi:hypothetical protein
MELQAVLQARIGELQALESAQRIARVRQLLQGLDVDPPAIADQEVEGLNNLLTEARRL